MKKTLILLICSTFILINCNEDESAPIIPEKAILGKWELIAQGISRDNLIELQPTYFTEFLNDSSYRIFQYKTEQFSPGDYTLNDTLLIYYYYAIELNNVVDTIPVRYYYTFEDSKTLLLDIDAAAIQDLFLYKKIE